MVQHSAILTSSSASTTMIMFPPFELDPFSALNSTDNSSRALSLYKNRIEHSQRDPAENEIAEKEVWRNTYRQPSRPEPT